MVNVLIVGDMHCKQKWILPQVDMLIEERAVDRVVFLGDYADEWHSTADDVIGALQYQTEWADSHANDNLMIEFLIGNHDFEYLRRAGCSATHREAMEPIRDALLRMDMKVATRVDMPTPTLVTHAGLTQKWRERYLAATDNIDEVASRLNGMLDLSNPEATSALASAGRSRGGSKLPGPLWADISDLRIDAAIGFDQVIGHTPVNTCRSIATLAGSVWTCDAFSLMSNMVPIGDASVLLVAKGIPSKLLLERSDIGLMP